MDYNRFRWNIMCYERPSLTSIIESKKNCPDPDDDWQVTVKDFPKDMDNVVGMLKQKIMMAIDESFEESMKEYKRYIIKS